MARPGKHSRRQSQLRIIGGQWRGRKLSFTPATGLRPTPDRVRETLFNWLAPVIADARCLDLFAGSGALGLEALSRGARFCEFVDTSRTALDQVQAHLRTLGAEADAACHAQPAADFLRSANATYDLVFLDPPFAQSLVAPACALLEQRRLLAPGAMVYIETPAGEGAPDVPANWHAHRDKVAGEVAYCLYENAAP